jgi:hypothetical protein
MALRTQIGAVWQESSLTTTGFTAQARNITAGSLVMGFFKAETSSVEISQTVTDTAGGTWNVVRAYFGSVNSHILYSFNHPGGTGVVISGAFTGGTVVSAETKIRFAEFDGSVGEANPVTESVSSGGGNLQLSHTHNVPVDGMTLAVQGSYYGVAFTLVSPATVLVYAYNSMNASIQTSSGSAVVHAGGGGVGEQANISVTVAPISSAADITPPSPGPLTATPTSSSLVTGFFPTNEDGTGYFLVSNNASESRPTVEAAALSAAATVGAGCTRTGLTWAAGQYLHAVQKDAAGNWSSVLSVLIADVAAPIATGPLTLSNITATACRVGGFSATDNLAVTGWRYRLDGGSWVTFGDGSTTYVDLSGLTNGATVLFELQARDAVPNWSNTLSKSFVVGATSVSVTGLDFRPVGARSATLRSPDFASYTLFTHIWWEWVENPAGPYYAGGFILSLADGTFNGADNYIMPVLHGTDGTFNTTTGQRSALAASPMHHEIATDGSDFIASQPGLVQAGETQQSFPAQYGAWVMRGCQAKVVGANLEIANYVDLSDPTKVIRHAVATSSITGSAVCFNLGQVPWASEEFRAKVFGLGVYTDHLTPAQMVSELNNFTNVPGVANCWFRNVFPAMSGSTLNDLKGSTPNNMTLRTAYAPVAFTEDIVVGTAPVWEDLPGATGTSYTTPAATAGMTGWQYRWVATNDNGSATSDPATLTVTSGVTVVDLQAAAQAQALATAVLDKSISLAAGAAGQATAGALLLKGVGLSGASLVVAASTADIDHGVPLSAAGAAVAAAGAGLSKTVALGASAAAQATAGASVSVALPLSATAVAVASSGAQLSLTVVLGAQALAVATAAAGLATGKPLAASGTAQAGGSAALSTSAANDLAAAAQAQAASSATLSLLVSLSGAAVAQAQAIASASVGKSLTGAAGAQAGAAADLQTSAANELAAAALARAQASAALAAGKPLAGTAAAQAGASAGLQVGVSTDLAANAQAAASGGATLWLEVPLSAAALAQSSAAGILALTVNLAASALASVSSSAQLTGSVTLGAAAGAVSTSTAALQVLGALDQFQRAYLVRRPRRSWRTRPAARHWTAKNPFRSWRTP